jgi:hypothetical protein
MNKPPKYECEHCPHYSTCKKVKCDYRVVFETDGDWRLITKEEYKKLREKEMKREKNRSWINAVQ